MRTVILVLLALGAICAPLKSFGTIPGVIYSVPPDSIVHAGSFEVDEETPPGEWRWNGPQLVGWAGWSGAAHGAAFLGLPQYVYQDLTTVPGQSYELRYYMAGDIWNQGQATMDALWGGSIVATTTWNTSGNSADNFGWIYTDIIVLATAPVTRLMFQNAGGIQPVIDAVSVVAVPEPPAVSISGILVFFAVTRRITRRMKENAA